MYLRLKSETEIKKFQWPSTKFCAQQRPRNVRQNRDNYSKFILLALESLSCLKNGRLKQYLIFGRPRTQWI
jgi:hypothetical protein